MPHRRWLCALVVLIPIVFATLPRGVQAQDTLAAPQVRYIEELKQRNDDYGPGCNGIGISVPLSVNVPDPISTRWAAGHSACIPGLRLVATCLGEIVAKDRVIGCTLQVADGGSTGELGCEQLTLITASARFQPDPSLSDALAEGSEGGSQSCSESVLLTTGTAIALAFSVPANASAGDLALTIDIDGSEVPAFLIPAGQVSGEMPARS